MNIFDIKNNLLVGNISSYIENMEIVISKVNNMLYQDTINVDELRCILDIYGILYNNIDSESLLIDDGIYDMLVSKYKSITGSMPVGAPVIQFDNMEISKYRNGMKECVSFLDKEEREKKLKIYPELFIDQSTFNSYNMINRLWRDKIISPILFTKDISKRIRNTLHEHPELVGTLDKCKFVLVKDAIDAGVDINDPKINILERDFFGNHIQRGIISATEEIEVMISIKYDGISVEADCSNVVESARSRGDTGVGEASDMTPILKGKVFPNELVGGDENGIPYGVKFEAIMTYADLYRFNMVRGQDYKNCRTAIIGLFGSSDAPMYRDYITLVPLDMSENDLIYKSFGEVYEGRKRLKRAAFMDYAFHSTNGIHFTYVVEKGNYMQILYLIKKFLEEADYARSFMPFMYDGIVVEYTSDSIREKLGRKNSVNQFAMAVKFNPLKKQTVFREYKYTVGKDGTITPMIYYDPVEFYGTIHPKSSGHSYKRFMELGLRYGDIIDITYTNEVMPYVSKPSNTANDNNPNPIIEFTKICPYCGGEVVVSESGKSAKCINVSCEGRKIGVMTDTLYKLGFVGFAEESVKDINLFTVRDIMTCPPDKLNLGDADTISFVNQRNSIMNSPMDDNVFMGSLGFTNIGSVKWGLILSKYTIKEVMEILETGNPYEFKSISGVGDKMVETIANEYLMYKQDIIFAINNMNIISTKGGGYKTTVRYTGFRNKQLVELLCSMGYDAKDGSVTKTTDILLIPYEGFTSSKTSKVGENTCIIPVQDFCDKLGIILP